MRTFLLALLTLLAIVVFEPGCGSRPAAAPVRPPSQVSASVPQVAAQAPSPIRSTEDDPHLWLEEIDSERALAWVRERNAVSQGELEGDPAFEPLRARLLSILDSEERIPPLTKISSRYYNFWRDGRNPRGLLRRTSLAEYVRAQPRWETVLDLDALAETEHENWVFKYYTCLRPARRRCLISLSRGGADASIVREFDMVTKRFVPGGFSLPEAKTTVEWQDLDTIVVATDFGPGTLTSSGYPREVRAWRRGTPLAEARLLIEGTNDDVRVSGGRSFTAGQRHDWVQNTHTFFSNTAHIRVGEDYVRLEKPVDAAWSLCGDRLILQLRTDWAVQPSGMAEARFARTYASGALLMIELNRFMGGGRDFAELFTPSADKALRGYACTRTQVIVTELEHVRTRLYRFRRQGSVWLREPIHTDVAGTQSVYAVDDETTDDYWHSVSDFLSPARYSLGNGTTGRLRPLKEEPAFFEANGLEVTQHFIASADGARIPYFEIRRPRESATPNAPTLLTAYGGFEIAMTPFYDALTGAGWLERGGTYVLANIRGGGEYGPQWHQAALRHNRQRAYDDFFAVAEDLVRRGVTTRERLGIEGASNGGLLVGVAMTQRPNLIGAVVCRVPLLDMRRYHRLLAGASWMEEFGNPELSEDWAALAQFSPYQNVRRDVHYPPALFLSSTRDDRVHPGHGRKMVERMLGLGQRVLYYENIEGGHGGAANNAQRAYMTALAHTFLWRTLSQ